MSDSPLRHSEDYVIGCCLFDEGHTLALAIEAGLRPVHFPSRGNLYAHLVEMHEGGIPIGLDTLVPRLNGEANPAELSALLDIGTTAHARHHIRELVAAGWRASEIAAARERIEALERGDLKPEPTDGPVGRPLGTFNLPSATDSSVLLGDRWLSRGDIAILASTSGMGKSSLSIQAAVTWGLGLPLFGGFRPRAALRSLIVQSEDGDGDIAEVRLSLEHAMALTPDQRAQVDANVLIVTDRTHRGESFRAELRRLIAHHKPDLVWINPLLAFIGGDVNDSTDVGTFLREQLNSLNEPAKFAYVIVHHTAKPPKEKKERQWNEVMYEMAGSADLTNAARAIIALQATETQGHFKLVLAKRGQRAGLTQKVPGVHNPDIKFDQPTSVIGLRHSTDRFRIGERELPVIHWERCDTPKAVQKPKTGRPPKYTFEQLGMMMPKPGEPFETPAIIHRRVATMSGISPSAFRDLLDQAARDGQIERRQLPTNQVVYGYAPQVVQTQQGG